jgi:pimeloyl-ACP methyl ester carboxylesterase
MEIGVGGVALHVDANGAEDGPPVVFLHGVAGSSAAYRWLPAEVTSGRRILRVDLRGHGRSGHAPGTYDIDRYGGDVAEVVRRVAGRPVVLVGHSLGGVTAWWVAQRHPELVVAALLEDPPLYMGEPAEHERNEIAKLAPLVRDQAAAWQRAGASAAEVTETIAAAPFGPDPSLRTRDALHHDAVAELAESLLSMDPEVLTGAADRSTLAATDVASPVEVPVVILAADDARGAAFPAAHERRLAETHPAVEVVRVRGAGHRIHAERAGRATYVAHLAEFLRRHAGAAG